MVREGGGDGISDRELTEALTRLQERVNDLRELRIGDRLLSMENLLQQIGKEYAMNYDKIKHISDRVSALETWKTSIRERVAVIAAGFGIMTSLIVRYGGSLMRILSGGTP